MPNWSDANTRGINISTRRLTLYALLFVSLAGLISGFAFGGFLHSNGNNTAKSTGPVITTTKTPQTTSNATPTPTTEPIAPLGIPQINQSTFTESAKSGTLYSISMQVINKQNKPVHASDITCKAWLVLQIPPGQALKIDDATLKNVSSLGNSIIGTLNTMPVPEVIGGLVFDPTTPQTGFCNSNGQMTWKYTISQTTVAPGSYSIVVVADWKGVHWNWSWVSITIV